MEEIQSHVWFLQNLPAELMDENSAMQTEDQEQPAQSVEDIMRIVSEATVPAPGLAHHHLPPDPDLDDDMDDLDSDPDLDIDSSGEIIYAI